MAAKDISQSHLADLSGVQQESISRILAGKTRRTRHLDPILDALGLESLVNEEMRYESLMDEFGQAIATTVVGSRDAEARLALVATTTAKALAFERNLQRAAFFLENAAEAPHEGIDTAGVDIAELKESIVTVGAKLSAIMRLVEQELSKAALIIADTEDIYLKFSRLQSLMIDVQYLR